MTGDRWFSTQPIQNTKHGATALLTRGVRRCLAIACVWSVAWASMAEPPSAGRSPGAKPSPATGGASKDGASKAGASKAGGKASPARSPAARRKATATRRAPLPKWSDEVRGVFFEDPVKEGLTGPRPEGFGEPVELQAGEAIVSGSTEGGEGTGTGATARGKWADVVSAATIEDEIKSIERRVADSIRTEGHFKGQGYKQAQTELAVAATLFGIIEGYDGTVRWQRDAPVARDLMARASSHARVSSTQVFREVQQRHQDLQDLVRGSPLTSEAGEKSNGWSEFTNRRMLMQRLDAYLQRQLAEWLSGAVPFQQNQAAIVREAELTAAIARVLVQEGMNDAGGEDYDGWCRQLEEAARKIAAAAQAGEYAPAREAHGDARKSCTDCHEVYRAQ